MIKETISLETSGQFPRLILDYYSGREDMESFYDFPPTLEGLKARLEARISQACDRELLCRSIEEQQGSMNLSDRQKGNLEALRTGKGYTVSTGHQLCLFTGPMFMLHKIASTIALAERMNKEVGGETTIVPIFWLATEDHDIAEVDHAHLFNKTLTFNPDYEGPAGRMPLMGIEEVLSELADILGDSEHARSIMDKVRNSYSEKYNLAQATQHFVNTLFAESGLLILDADSHELKRPFIPLMKKELEESFVSTAMESALGMLESRGEKVQATPREVNLFYMRDDLRSRIIYEDGEYSTAEGGYHWEKEVILAELESHPERFSPNVVFRPLYQELLLPNLAYIGGPGELSYWLQLKGVFHAAGWTLPVLILRDSLIWMDAKSLEKWNDLGFSIKDLFRSEDELQKAYALTHAEEDVDLIAEKESLIHHFDKLIEKSSRVDNGLVQFAKAERQRLENAVDTLEKKMVRAEKKKHSDALNRISQLKSKFLPEGALQERKENFLPLWLRYGQDYFSELHSMCNPLEPGVKVLIEQ
jgi:bacillithiol biosynthesis cysteine-adding enzyme BshC